MSRSLLAIFLVSWSMLSAHAVAQVRHDLPGLNSVGRFFGVGYTLGGYHAGERDGRFDLSRRSPTARFPASHNQDFGLHRLGPQWNVAPCPTCPSAGSQPSMPVDHFHSSPDPTATQPTEAPAAEYIRLDATPTALHYDLSPAPAPGPYAAQSTVIASNHLSTPTSSTIDTAPPDVAVKNLWQQASTPPVWRARY